MTPGPGPAVEALGVEQPQVTTADPGVSASGLPVTDPASIQALDELPRTGGVVNWLAALGVLLVGTGGLSVLVGRRRSAPSR